MYFVDLVLSFESGAIRRIRHNRYLVLDWVPVASAAWVDQQAYVNPYPKELMLRNHV